MEVQHPSQALGDSNIQQIIWDETRLEEAMNRLKLLHIKARTRAASQHGETFLADLLCLQVRNLRDAIPKMLEPLAKPHSTRMYFPFRSKRVDLADTLPTSRCTIQRIHVGSFRVEGCGARIQRAHE